LTIPFESNATTASANRLLLTHNVDVYLLQPQQNDLEQLFIDITSNNI
jgi:lantibiotic transport system ATP-binding protein